MIKRTSHKNRKRRKPVGERIKRSNASGRGSSGSGFTTGFTLGFKA